jgi:hypothetical protein
MADLRQFRYGFTVAALGIAGLCSACSSDQKAPNTPEDVPPAEAPQDASPPPAGDAPPPNGEPTNTPPAEPAPQGSNGNAPSNMIGAPKSFASASRPLDARYP